MQVSSNTAVRLEGVNASMLATTQSIIAQQGWQGLFRGVYLNYIKVAPATAVGFAVYDRVKDAMGLDNHM
jgi:Mitochondrial carrier protein